MVKRYMPMAQNFSSDRYSGFRGGISFGTRRNAQKFINTVKKGGVYTKFKIKVIDV